MKYVWECLDCKKESEVIAKVDDRNIPPKGGCPICASSNISRVQIPQRPKGVKGFVLEGHGWHDQDYSSYKSRK